MNIFFKQATRYKTSFILLLISFVTIANFTHAPHLAIADDALPAPHWVRSWSPDIFEKAKKENKLVLLDMEAVWCHWCHVMDRETYANPDVLSLINKHFIAAKIDQDSYLDLSVRYRRWGWPATVFFTADGQEITKLRGYIDPGRMKEILEDIIKDPSPENFVQHDSMQNTSPASEGLLTQDQRENILDVYWKLYDERHGGWGRFHRFIDGTTEEFILRQAAQGNQESITASRKTLDGGLHLIDPVWGGAYQYSDELDWLSPHYEKINDIQRAYLHIYSLGHSIFQDPKYLQAAQDIVRYLQNILMNSDGVFYTSQNADLTEEIDGKEFYSLDAKGRNALVNKHGMPRIDKAIYSQTNGWIIQGLCDYYNASGDENALQMAIKAANWLLRNHRRRDNGFVHGLQGDIHTRSQQYLVDNIAMAQAFLSLYESTANRKWLKESIKTAEYVLLRFQDPEQAGYFGSVLPKDSVFDKAFKDEEENVSTARFMIRLYHYSGKDAFKDGAMQAMRFLASPERIENKPFQPGTLITDSEIKNGPIHIVVVGPKADLSAKKLFQESLKHPSSYKHIEWYDRNEGKLPSAAGLIEYPTFDKPAAFACANGVCSAPVFEPGTLQEVIQDFL